MGAVFTGFFLVRTVAPLAMYVYCLLALSAGALLHGRVLDRYVLQVGERPERDGAFPEERDGAAPDGRGGGDGPPDLDGIRGNGDTEPEGGRGPEEEGVA